MAGSALWNVCRVIATISPWDLCCVSPVFYRPVCVVFLYSNAVKKEMGGSGSERDKGRHKGEQGRRARMLVSSHFLGASLAPDPLTPQQRSLV